MTAIPLTAIAILPGFWLLNLLTAGTVGGFHSPVFSGLAWALIFGLLASTTFTLVVVPVVYFIIYDKGDGQPAV